MAQPAYQTSAGKITAAQLLYGRVTLVNLPLVLEIAK
jgi:hypothetical protein